MKNKITRTYTLTEETDKALETIRLLRSARSKSDVIDLLVSEEVRRLNGEEVTPIYYNSNLTENFSDREVGSNYVADGDYINLNKLEENVKDMQKVTKTLLSIMRSVDRRVYVMYEGLNVQLDFISDDGDVQYKSIDRDLGFENEENMCEVYVKSNNNYNLKAKKKVNNSNEGM